jgi:ankyrin repeat protein
VNKAVQATGDYIELVARSIAEGKEDVEPHKDGVTALMLAAQGGHLVVVEQLVAGGADVRLSDDDGMTALLSAIKGGFGDLAVFLVTRGADPNDSYTDESDVHHNLLMDAVAASNTEFALLLIDKGADISFADDEGVTILTQASFLGNIEVVRALLAAGANVTERNNEGVNALIAAASEGHVDLVSLLLAAPRADINCQDKDGTNALMAAAVRGHAEVARVLLEHGADPNALNVDGHTALMFAYNGKAQVETLLHKYRSYLDGADDSTKLIQDALQTHLQVVQLLINSGADVTIRVSALIILYVMSDELIISAGSRGSSGGRFRLYRSRQG